MSTRPHFCRLDHPLIWVSPRIAVCRCQSNHIWRWEEQARALRVETNHTARDLAATVAALMEEYEMANSPEDHADLSPRARVRLWIKDQVKDEAVVQLPDLTDRAVGHFSKQRKFVAEFLSEQLRPIIYQETRRVIAQTREVVLHGDDLIDRGELEKRGQRLISKWGNWTEHVGDRHLRLADMTRADLLVAAAEREARGAAEYAIGQHWRALASRLGDTERVGERFTDDEIEAVRLQLRSQDKRPDADAA